MRPFRHRKVSVCVGVREGVREAATASAPASASASVKTVRMRQSEVDVRSGYKGKLLRPQALRGCLREAEAAAAAAAQEVRVQYNHLAMLDFRTRKLHHALRVRGRMQQAQTSASASPTVSSVSMCACRPLRIVAGDVLPSQSVPVLAERWNFYHSCCPPSNPLCGIGR